MTIIINCGRQVGKVKVVKVASFGFSYRLRVARWQYRVADFYRAEKVQFD